VMTGAAPSVVTEIAEPGGGLMLRMTMERGRSTARRKTGAAEGGPPASPEMPVTLE
jgi:hypothetical protein